MGFLRTSRVVQKVIQADAGAFAFTDPGTTQLTKATPVTGTFNGGKSQVVFNFLGPYGDYPFLNLAKGLANWALDDGSDVFSPNEYDANGYPIAMRGGGATARMYAPTQAARSRKYVLKWTSAGGTTKVEPNCNETPFSGSVTATGGANGRYVFTPGTNVWNVSIRTVGVSNLVICHEDDENSLDTGHVFGVKFLQRLVEAKFGVLRFLDWQHGNTSNLTTWATRKPVSYYSYAADEYRPGIYAGTTTKTGSAYSVSFPGFVLADKATVTVRFNTGVTGACTLNVNSTGAKNMLNDYAQAIGGYEPIGADDRPWLSIGTLTYDITLDAWIKKGSDNARGSRGLDNGVPPEMMVQLCNEVGAHPWFVAPHYAIDPMTDFHPTLAAYCRDNGFAGMIPRFEGPNELWNTFGGFDGTSYATAKATAYGWSGNFNEWMGKVMSTVGQAVSTVYSADRSKYQVICGVQTGLGDTSGNRANSDPRLESPGYLGQVAPPQSPYTKSAAKTWVTHICVANYVTPSRYGTSQEVIDGWGYTVLGTTSVAADYADKVADATGLFTTPAILTLMGNWKSWAQSHSIQKMAFYEGGYSPDYTALETSSPIESEGGPIHYPSSIITAASAAASCVLTFSDTYNSGYVYPGNPAVVGMPVVIVNMTGTMGTKLNNPDMYFDVPTFTAGQANITCTNTLIVGQGVFFFSKNRLPTDFVFVSRAGMAGKWTKPYWVVARTSTTFQISATKGGAPITFTNTGDNFQNCAQECWMVSAVSGNNVTRSTWRRRDCRQRSAAPRRRSGVCPSRRSTICAMPRNW